MKTRISAADINAACEEAFGRSADVYDLRVFDFAKIIIEMQKKIDADICENTEGVGSYYECAEAIRKAK